MMKWENNKKILLWGAFLFVVFIIIPVFAKSFYIFMITEMIIFALFAISYNMLLGYAGLLSFGHAMFFGTGAYAAAVAINRFPQIPFLGALLFAIVISAVLSFIIGALLLRHKGTPFALLTLAFQALIFAIATKWYTLTGGDDGLNVARPDINLGFTTLNLADITVFYFVTVVIVGALILFCWYFTKSAMGKTVLLMRENEERMKFLGYNTAIARLILFTFTGTIAGFAGAFYAFFFEFTSITAISPDMTTTVLVITFIGGTGSFVGPILGSVVFIYLQNLLSDITDRWQFFMGIIFIVMVLFVPGGLSGAITSIKNRFLEYRNRGNGIQIEGEN
jgi:branched-chain amino acid transport system permease protein